MEYNITTEQYQSLKAAWKKLADAKDIYPRDILIYNILRNKDLKRGFASTTNICRIQGNDPWFSFKKAVDLVKWVYTPLTYYAKKNLESNQTNFEKRYGIPLSAEILELIKGVQR